MGADGRRLFSRGVEKNVSKVVMPLKNGSRGGDTPLEPRRGGVEEGGGGRGGGQTNFL